ncbi:MAG: glycosyltransferase [bacterium]
MSSDEPKYRIAILMPVLNEETFIGQTLDQIYMQDFPMDRVEIVVADGGSTDRTREIVEGFRSRFGSLKILDNPRRLASSGRNLGVKNSIAPCILILDGHTYLPRKTILTDMLELFDTYEADCLCRPQPLTPPDIGEFERAVAHCRESLLGHNPGSDIYSDFEGVVDPTSSGAMYKRSVFDKVGYFDEEFDACEDVDFNYRVQRAGLKAIISPKVRVFYYPRQSLAGLWRQMMRYGKGRFHFSQKHSKIAPMQTLAAAGVAGLGILAVLSLVSSSAWSLLTTLFGVYLLVAIGFSAFVGHRKSHLGTFLLGPLIFPVIHFGLGWGFLTGVFDKFVSKPQRPPKMDLRLW